MMKKLFKFGIVGLMLSMTLATPVLAATNTINTSTYQAVKGDKIVSQGDGYLVVIPTEQKKQVNNNSAVGVQPLATTSYTMSQGGSGTYAGSSWQNYANGQLEDYSSITVADQHQLVGNDTMEAYGRQYVDYSGTNPYNADSYTLAPSETVTASATVVAASIPSGVSFSPIGASATLSWLSQSITNNFTANYYWNQWEVSSQGKFTGVSANDQVSWRFGTTIIGQINTVKITIQ